MQLANLLAKHIRDVHFGGNWTSVNLKDALAGISWQQATLCLPECHSIAALVYHANYYISAVTGVLQGHPLQAKDAFSFDLAPIQCQADWEKLLSKTWTDAANFATLVEQLPEHKLWEPFTDEQYGSYYRNIQGIIEHTHYHLGQIVQVKKILESGGRAILPE